MKATISHSIGSSETYFTCQFRMLNSTTMKVQIASTYVNRPYGCMFHVDMSKFGGLAELLANHVANDSMKVKSLADSKETYSLARFRVLPNNMKIRFQVHMEEVNRPYGLVFDVYQIGLYKSLKAHIEYWYKNL